MSPQNVFFQYRCLWNTFGMDPTGSNRSGELFVSSYDVDARKSGCTLDWLAEILASLDSNMFEYGDHAGPAELRDIICDLETARGSSRPNSDEVLITQSATSALFVILHHLCQDANLPIIGVHCPTYYAVEAIASSLRCKTIRVDRDRTTLTDAVLQCTEAVAFLVTNPTFPDGMYILPGDLEAAVEITRRNGQLLIIDEAFTYVPLIEEPPKYDCLSEEHVVRVRSFSKMWGFSALRGGCILASPPVLRHLAESAELLFCRTNKLTNDIYTRVFRLHRRLLNKHQQDDNMFSSYHDDWYRHIGALRETLGVIKTWSPSEDFLVRSTEAGFNTQIEFTNRQLGKRWFEFVTILAKEHRMMVHFDNVLTSADCTHCLGRIRLSLALSPKEMSKALRCLADVADRTR